MLCFKCLTNIDLKLARYGLHPECFSEWFSAPQIAEFVSLQRKSSASDRSTNLALQNTSFYHGKFKKYSADLNGQSYILKMRQDEAPEIPEVEYLCNQIGKALNIPVAEFYFINFNEDPTFVTKSFINPKTPTDLQPIYRFRADDQHSCKGIIKVIIEKTQRPYDVKTFVKTILFDALIGNHDRHGKNLAFLVTAKNTVLSPIYDNVSYLSLEHGKMLKADFNPTGRISTNETREPNMCDYVKELKKLGYQIEIQQFYQTIKMPHLLKLIDESFCSDLMKNAIKRLIQKRFEELKNELSN